MAKDMKKFIEDADADAQLLAGFYKEMNKKNFNWGQIKKYLVDDHGYGDIDLKADRRSLEALHGATQALFECGIKY